MKLDYYQKKAVFSNYKNILIVAPPGSGKTHVILNRAIYLMQEKKISGENIIIITFTKMAAENMKKRFKEMITVNNEPFFGTFHSLFYKILKNENINVRVISYRQKYHIINESLKEYIENITEEKIKDMLNNISFYKNNGFINKTNMNREVFEFCYITYEKYKKDNKLIDFDDLQTQCRDLLYNNKNILWKYLNKIKFILVDEFQDTDKTQIQILKILNKDNSIFAVGDEDQSIYSFRGSNPECMLSFNEDFNYGKKLFLLINYRSVYNIVFLSRKLIENNKLRNFKEIKADKNYNGIIKNIILDNENQQGQSICFTIKELIKSNKMEYKDMAILYRTNFENKIVIDSLLQKEIPFKIMDKEFNLYNYFPCKHIIYYLKLYINNEDRISFSKIINKPFRYINRHYINELMNCYIKDSCFEIMYQKDLALKQIKTLKTLERRLKKIGKIPMKDVVEYILYNLNYIDYIKYYCLKNNVNQNQVLRKVFILQNHINRFKTIESYLTSLKDNIKHKKNLNKNCVTLSTIHSAKGTEFKNVFILNCVEGNIPYIDKGKEFLLEEERRIFYVAITRAIQNLYIYVPKHGKEMERIPSRFLEECDLNKEKNSSNFKIGDNVYYGCFGEGRIKKINKYKIDIVFRSGIEKNFYLDKAMKSGLMEVK